MEKELLSMEKELLRIIKEQYEINKEDAVNMEKELFRIVKEQYEEFEKGAGKVKKNDKRNILIGMILGIIAADRVYDFNLNKGFAERGIQEIEKMM